MSNTEPDADPDTFYGRLDSDDEEDKGTKEDNQEKDISDKQPAEGKDSEDGPKEVIRPNLLDSDDDEDDKVSSPTKSAVKSNLVKDDSDDDDSEDSEDSANKAATKNTISDDDESDKDAASDKGEIVNSKSKRKKGKAVTESDSEDDEESEDGEEDDDDEKKEDKDQDGDQEDNDDDVIGDDEDSDSERHQKQSNNTIYDFDIMMAKKKEENSKKRRRRGYDIINDNDDIIADIINQMKDAVEADIEANRNKQVATNKLKLLPFLINQLRKVDLRDAFLDSDVLSVITEWLAPLPDRSLPHLNIRENLLKILIDFNLYDVDRIKGSGIGKAIMYLYKHPRETKENKQRAKQLISAWSRPIFNLDSSFSAISREEREERDKELKRRASRTADSSDGEGSSQVSKRVKESNQPAAKNPGEKGWIPRARVPAPSMRDYVIRPRSKVDGDIGKGSKRPANMLEKLMKTHQERRRANKQQRAINMKIDKL